MPARSDGIPERTGLSWRAATESQKERDCPGAQRRNPRKNGIVLARSDGIPERTGLSRRAATESAQRKIPVVLHPVHQSPRFHGQKSILLLFIHENTAFRGQKHHKACGTSTFGVARAACYEELAFVFTSSGALHNQSGFQLSSGNMPVFPDDPVQIVPFVREIRHFSGQACQFENFIRGKSDFPGHGCF